MAIGGEAVIFPSYREHAVAVVRGIDAVSLAAQWAGRTFCGWNPRRHRFFPYTLVLAAQAHEREVRTVEGVTASDRLHPIQEAFVEAGAVQCGFCTPGFVVAVADLLQKDPTPSPATVREALSGNLCRCTGYQKILDAVSLAASRMGAKP